VVSNIVWIIYVKVKLGKLVMPVHLLFAKMAVCRFYCGMAELRAVPRLKAFPYSLPCVGPGADPGVQAVAPHGTISHPPGGSLPA